MAQCAIVQGEIGMASWLQSSHKVEVHIIPQKWQWVKKWIHTKHSCWPFFPSTNRFFMVPFLDPQPSMWLFSSAQVLQQTGKKWTTRKKSKTTTHPKNYEQSAPFKIISEHIFSKCIFTALSFLTMIAMKKKQIWIRSFCLQGSGRKWIASRRGAWWVLPPHLGQLCKKLLESTAMYAK